MNTTRAGDVDDYFAALFVGDDVSLDRALAASDAQGLPPIAVSPTQGKFLYILACVRGARRILEIGTLGGYSTLWFARALAPNGKVITLEISPERAALARKNLDAAGVSDRVTIHVGAAVETLSRMIADGEEPFDLVFIDADKSNNSEYVRSAIQLSRVGTVIVLDNVVRDGAVIDEGGKDPNIVGTRSALAMLAQEPRVQATALQTVGQKGYDGFAIALVVA